MKYCLCKSCCEPEVDNEFEINPYKGTNNLQKKLTINNVNVDKRNYRKQKKEQKYQNIKKIDIKKDKRLSNIEEEGNNHKLNSSNVILDMAEKENITNISPDKQNKSEINARRKQIIEKKSFKYNNKSLEINCKDDICKIVAMSINNYPSILKRMSNVELYYLCENFLARDQYNNKKRNLKETADKLISFAKGECVDVDDVKQLKLTDFNPLESEARIEHDSLCEYEHGFSKDQYYKNGKLAVPIQTLWQEKEKYMNKYKSSTKAKRLGEGGHSAIFAFNKSNILSTKHKDKSLAIAVSVHDKHELNHFAYRHEVICSKILLSLFARQTKYYTDFMMKVILAKKKMNSSLTQNDMEAYNSMLRATFENISLIERNKEIARELFFSIADRKKINILPMYPPKGYTTENSLVKNRMLDDNGKFIEIDLDVLEPIKEEYFIELWQFVDDNKASFELSEIFSNLKKNLTISPKLIAYHTLMELKKYEFKDFNDEKHANCIKDTLKAYQRLLSATKDNFLKIDKDVVKICEKQLKLYDDYIATINKYSLEDFENDFQQEQEQITSKINKHRSMSGIIKGKTKKLEPIPLQGCNNNVAKNQYLKEGKKING